MFCDLWLKNEQKNFDAKKITFQLYTSIKTKTATQMITSNSIQLWKNSHRSLIEQFVGASIIGLFSIAFGIFETWFFPQEFTSINFLIFTLLHAMVAASFWTVWRSHSLRNLKIELSLFFCFIFFKTLWSLSYYFLQEPLLSLIALILWLSNGLILFALFRKKEKTSGWFLIFPLFCIFYLVLINMTHF